MGFQIGALDVNLGVCLISAVRYFGVPAFDSRPLASGVSPGFEDGDRAFALSGRRLGLGKSVFSLKQKSTSSEV